MLYRDLLRLSVAMGIGVVSQHLFILTDMRMIRPFSHSAWLGIGMGTLVFFTIFISLIGIAVAVQAITARYVGEKRSDRLGFPLKWGVITGAVVSTVVAIGGMGIVPVIPSLMTANVAVSEAAVGYIIWRLIGLPFAVVMVITHGFWNGFGEPKRYILPILVMHGCNGLLNMGLIGGRWGFPAWGAMGAGLASTVATGIGMAICLWQVWPYLRIRYAETSDRLTPWMMRLALPITLQQVSVAIGNTVLYGVLSHRDETSMVLGNSIIPLISLIGLVAIGFGVALVTVVSTGLGEKNSRVIQEAPNRIARLAFVPIGFIALALFVMPTIVLAAMGVTGDAPPGAVMAARMAAIGILAESGAILYMHALYGIDQAKVVAMVSIIGYWGVYMATVYGLGRYTTSSYGMWIGYLIFQLIHFAAFRMIWRGQSKNCIRVAIPAQHS